MNLSNSRDAAGDNQTENYVQTITHGLRHVSEVRPAYYLSNEMSHHLSRRDSALFQGTVTSAVCPNLHIQFKEGKNKSQRGHCCNSKTGKEDGAATKGALLDSLEDGYSDPESAEELREQDSHLIYVDEEDVDTLRCTVWAACVTWGCCITAVFVLLCFTVADVRGGFFEVMDGLYRALTGTPLECAVGWPLVFAVLGALFMGCLICCCVLCFGSAVGKKRKTELSVP